MMVTAFIKRELAALWSGGKGMSLIVIAAGWGSLVGVRMIYPVLLPHLRTAFGLSLTVSGLLITVLWLGAAVGQLPGGILADRYSERSVMSFGAVVVAMSLGAVIVAPTVTLLFVATAITGLGQSMYPIARITILSTIYPDRIGSALGITMATGDLGQTLLPPIAGVLAVAIAWQAGLAFMIPILLVVAISVWFVLPAQPATESAVDTLSVESFRYILAELRKEDLLFISFILFLYIMIWQSFTAFYPTYLQDVKGLSSATATLIFGLYFACGVVVKPLAGVAYDRLGMRYSLLLVLIGPFFGFALLPLVDEVWMLVVLTALTSIMLGSGAITQSFLADRIADDIQGTGLGIIRTTVATLGAAGPVLFGVIADFGYFDEGYFILAIGLFVIILLILRLPRY